MVIRQSLSEFFFHSLQQVADQQSVNLSEQSEHYLMNMLVRFASSEQLFVHDESGYGLPTLAFLYRDALNAVREDERLGLLQKLGDTALFVGAVYPKVWRRRGLNEDYFVGMGMGAYAARGAYEVGDASLYVELSEQFESFMYLVRQTVTREAPPTEAQETSH